MYVLMVEVVCGLLVDGSVGSKKSRKDIEAADTIYNWKGIHWFLTPLFMTWICRSISTKVVYFQKI